MIRCVPASTTSPSLTKLMAKSPFRFVLHIMRGAFFSKDAAAAAGGLGDTGQFSTQLTKPSPASGDTGGTGGAADFEHPAPAIRQTIRPKQSELVSDMSR